MEGTYTYTVVTAGAKFAVSNAGVVTIATTLDFETVQSEVVTVEVCDIAAAIANQCNQAPITVSANFHSSKIPTLIQYG